MPTTPTLAQAGGKRQTFGPDTSLRAIAELFVLDALHRDEAEKVIASGLTLAQYDAQSAYEKAHTRKHNTGESYPMFGHPLARKAEEWWKAHGGKHDDPEWAAYLGRFNDHMQSKFAELTQEHSNYGRFGMSKAGGCMRAAGLSYLGAESAEISGSVRHTFMLGHILECAAQSLLESCGLTLWGEQGLVEIQPMLLSFHDNLTEIDGVQTVVSYKSAGYKKSGKERGKWVRRGFPELPFAGVRMAQPSWYAQIQMEMHGGGYQQGLVFVTSKDMIKSMEGDPYLGDGGGKGNGSLTFYAELIPYDRAFAEQAVQYWQWAWDAVRAGQLPQPLYFGPKGWTGLDIANTQWMPNADRTGSFNPCGYCDLLEACQNAKPGA